MYRLIFYATIPVIFLYPHALFYQGYWNYIYILFCFFFFLLTRVNGKISFNYTAVKFFGGIFFVNLLANIISLSLGYIDVEIFAQGNIVQLCNLLLSIVICNTKKYINSWFKVFYWTIIVVVFLIFIDGLFSPVWLDKIYHAKSNLEYANTQYYRATGSLLSPNMAGFFSAMLVFYFFVKIKYKSIHKYEYIFLLISVFALIMTASRTAMLGLFIVYIFYSIKEGINLKWIAVAFMLFGIIIYWGGDLLGNYFENLSYRNEQFEKGYFAGTGRLVTILSALKYKFDFRCLFFGIGSGEYSVVESTSFSLAHNGFLSIFLPFGILGLMLYYYVFYKEIKFYYQKKNNSRYFIQEYSFFVYLFIVFTLGTFITADTSVNFYWLFLFVCISSFVDCYKSEISVKAKI